MAHETMMTVCSERYRTIHIIEIPEATTNCEIRPASWIFDYFSVEVVSSYQRDVFRSIGKATIFTADQIAVYRLI